MSVVFASVSVLFIIRMWG